METAIVHLETVARVEARDHTDQPVTQVGMVGIVVMVAMVVMVGMGGQGGGWVSKHASFCVFVSLARLCSTI